MGMAVVASTTLVSAMDVVVHLLHFDSFSFQVVHECVFYEAWAGIR
jgi:hypothetical protein